MLAVWTISCSPLVNDSDMGLGRSSLVDMLWRGGIGDLATWTAEG